STTTQEPHKERFDELGKFIAQRMDVLEGTHTSMSSVMLIIEIEQGESAQDELESITVDIADQTEKELIEWHALQEEIKEEYLELILQDG
ncbi:hypothetical protein KI387_014851, partial [Taxus chinensis]